jgi:dihydroxyacetone kinase-like protein
MKKLINYHEGIVEESLAGMAAAFPHLIRLHTEVKAVLRKDAPVRGKVALLSGGGSGHEPLHGGYVGKGMLDAACPGEIFTSPTPDQIYEAAKAVHGGKGILFLVKNYTGDVMNFQMATEMLKAEGLPVEQVVINDDVAVKDSLYTAGRRGVAGTVLVEKIVGARAEQGASLEELKDLAERVNAQVRSLGMALTSCTVPAAGKPTFELGEQEMEIGIGIHGEPGRERKAMQSAREIMEIMGTALVEDLPFVQGDSVLALVNGMGGTPLLELFIMFHELKLFLDAREIVIARSLVGNYCTSLEMQGCSITLLKMNQEFLDLWDAPVSVPAFFERSR